METAWSVVEVVSAVSVSRQPPSKTAGMTSILVRMPSKRAALAIFPREDLARTSFYRCGNSIAVGLNRDAAPRDQPPELVAVQPERARRGGDLAIVRAQRILDARAHVVVDGLRHALRLRGRRVDREHAPRGGRQVTR